MELSQPLDHQSIAKPSVLCFSAKASDRAHEQAEHAKERRDSSEDPWPPVIDGLIQGCCRRPKEREYTQQNCYEADAAATLLCLVSGLVIGKKKIPKLSKIE